MLRRHLLLLVAVVLVILAAYVSIGRQFMPAVSRNVDFFEQRITAITGLPVSIDSLDGSFVGFNPVLTINGLQVLVVHADNDGADDADSNSGTNSANDTNATTNGTTTNRGLMFASAVLIIDVPRSLWQRRWIIKDFTVESLELDLRQTESGEWQISELGLDGSEDINPDDIYQSFLRVARLNLNSLLLNVHPRTAEPFRLWGASATIQNQGNNHYIHINSRLEDIPRPLRLSIEVRGSRLASMSGNIFMNLPMADYTNYANLITQNELEFSTLQVGGNFWLGLRDGQFASFSAVPSAPLVDFSIGEEEPITLSSVSGRISFTRQRVDNLTDGAVSDSTDGAEDNAAGDSANDVTDNVANNLTNITGGLASLIGLTSLTDNTWQLKLQDVGFNWHDLSWHGLSALAEHQQEQTATLRINQLDLNTITEFAIASGLLSEDARQELEQYAPSGSLHNLDAIIPLTETATQPLQLKTNLQSVALSSVRGSPSLGGVNGYLELEYEQTAKLLTGRTEVESNEFHINIPNTFTRTWDYNFVNGALDFSVDLSTGREIRLSSSLITAEADTLSGRVEFSYTEYQPPQQLTQQIPQQHNPREAQLDLLVGATRMDAAARTLYLPDGPNVRENLRNSMEWLSRALTDGEVYDTGIIYRGSTLQGSAPEASSFQSFYRLRNGSLKFSEDWPALQNIQATIVTDNNNVDIQVAEAGSHGVIARDVTGIIRPNNTRGNNQPRMSQLQVHGEANAPLSSGLNYLQNAPIGQAARATLADWQTTGNFDAIINITMPLDNLSATPGDASGTTPGNTSDITSDNPSNEATNITNTPGQPHVTVDITLPNNTIEMSEYALLLEDVNGELHYDTATGLSSKPLATNVFNEPTTITLSSAHDGAELKTIIIDAATTTTPATLAAWPRQSEFVRRLLARAEGHTGFALRLELDQSGYAPLLTINSDLVGTALNYPTHFTKPAADALPLYLELRFPETGQDVSGYLGRLLNFAIHLEDGQLPQGLLQVHNTVADNTETPDSTDPTETTRPGLVISGEIESLNVNEWTEFINHLAGVADSSATTSQMLAFADLEVNTLELDQALIPKVNLHIEPHPTTDSWQIGLSGETTQGQVNLPFNPADRIHMTLDYLRLPGDETDEATDTSAEEIERKDVLADVDPRQLPAMRFSTEELKIGAREYGSWAFTLDPTSEGATITNLQFDFRGLRAGLDYGPDNPDPPPQFNWWYDGQTHRSTMRSILHANDVSTVLRANGYAATLNSSNARFDADLSWPGTPAFFSGRNLSGKLVVEITEGRFQQGSDSTGPLKLISLLNFDAIVRRLRFSDDLLHGGLAYDEITATMNMDNGQLHIEDRLVISGPSSLYQITGDVDLAQETITGELYVTLPFSDNIPWVGVLTANLPLAIGAYLFDRVFGDQVDSLTSAVYTLEGPWEGLEPEFKQAFGSPPDAPSTEEQEQEQGQTP